MVEIVNISAGGDLQTEIDLKEFAADIDLAQADYDPENHWLLLRFEEEGSLIILYRTGKYILRGGDTYEQCYEARDDFLELCKDMDIIETKNKTEFEVKNVVCLGNFGSEIDLSTVMILLGLENTEYEPEQFSGLVYRPPDRKYTMMIFHSGKVIITGTKDEEEAAKAMDDLNQRLSPNLTE